MSLTGQVLSESVHRPMRADARRNYDRLLAEAAAAFAERGTDDVSLEEIARRAEVGIGTLYRHFPTRQALLEGVYREQVEQLARQSERLTAADVPPGQAFAVWLKAITDFGRTKRSMNAALLATLGQQSELLSLCSAMLRETTAALLERAQQSGEARTDVRGADVLRLVHGLMVADGAAPGDPGQADRMLVMVVDGILTGPDPAGGRVELHGDGLGG